MTAKIKKINKEGIILIAGLKPIVTYHLKAFIEKHGDTDEKEALRRLKEYEAIRVEEELESDKGKKDRLRQKRIDKIYELGCNTEFAAEGLHRILMDTYKPDIIEHVSTIIKFRDFISFVNVFRELETAEIEKGKSSTEIKNAAREAKIRVIKKITQSKDKTLAQVILPWLIVNNSSMEILSLVEEEAKENQIPLRLPWCINLSFLKGIICLEEEKNKTPMFTICLDKK